MSEKPSFSPGCFGSALGYKEDDVCGACEFREQCREVHLVARREFNEFFGINTVAKKRRRDGLTKKAAAAMEECGKTAEEIKIALANGINPFSVRKGFLGVVTHVLLKAVDPTPELVAKFIMSARSVGAETADSYVRLTIQILRHADALEDGSLRIKGSK